jgi:cell division protein FtsB
MPDLDLKALREIAEKATQEPGKLHSVKDAEFIATFNPVTVLALLQWIEDLDKLANPANFEAVVAKGEQLAAENAKLKEIIKADVWKLPTTPEVIDADLQDPHGTVPHGRIFRLIAEVKSLRARIKELEKRIQQLTEEEGRG